jgi:hypothetical protein
MRLKKRDWQQKHLCRNEFEKGRAWLCHLEAPYSFIQEALLEEAHMISFVTLLLNGFGRVVFYRISIG